MEESKIRSKCCGMHWIKNSSNEWQCPNCNQLKDTIEDIRKEVI